MSKPVTLEEIKIHHQQSVAAYIIALLRQIDPHACVAGGAPRDWYLGIPAQDLDFYYNPAPSTEFHIKEHLERILNMQVDFHTSEEYSVFEHEYLENVFVVDLQGCKLQFIALRPPYQSETIHTTFPFDICQVKYTPGKGIHTTEVFLNAVKTKTVSQVDNLYNSDYGSKIEQRFESLGYTVNPWKNYYNLDL